MIIDSILKTDMAFHLQICDDFKKRTLKFISQDKQFDKTKNENKTFLMSVLVHGVDIGAAGLGLEDFLFWG